MGDDVSIEQLQRVAAAGYAARDAEFAMGAAPWGELPAWRQYPWLRIAATALALSAIDQRLTAPELYREWSNGRIVRPWQDLTAGLRARWALVADAINRAVAALSDSPLRCPSGSRQGPGPV